MEKLNQVLWAAHEGLVDRLLYERAAQGHHAARDPFGESHDVGHHPKAVGGE